MDFFIEALIAFFLILSGIFGLVGSYGLVKLRETMSRLHAPTKATTLGVGGVLIASILHSTFIEGHLSLNELLITLFLFLTAPITAHFIAKAYIHHNFTAKDLPDPGGDRTWAALNEDEQA
jgi:multicomponent K+:H+ antiporter subunit G